MKDYKMYIGGQWVGSANGETFDDLDPYSGEVFGKIPKAGAKDVELAMAAAYKAREEWSATPPPVRGRKLMEAARILEAKRAEFADILTHEGGSSFGKAMFEIDATVDLLYTAAGDSKLVMGETFHTNPGRFNMSVRKPRGTIVTISPWNFPLILSMYKIAYGLATGNTVVHKPSSETPAIGLKAAELFHEAGFPAGAMNVITGPGGALGDLLIADKRCSYVAVTGSTETGRHVAETAAKNFKQYYLELGGKNPLIILADANMEYAVKTTIMSAFMHQGEICMSADRIIVEEKIADEFAASLAEFVSHLLSGDPSNPATFIGPVISDRQVESIHAHVTDAVNKGAKLLTGGTYEGRVYKPTVLKNIKPDMDIYYEETFGPVASVIPVKDEKEALAVANDTRYGLSSGIITSDYEKAMYLANGMEAGMVHVNSGTVDADSVAPFGGLKESGMGREGGRYSWEEFTDVRWVTMDIKKQQYPF
ncbi:MAG: aldehyde dehydrogenase family protein [Treponema sp.]|jgi:aldehyde dehydrogenase (NAD+)|nr:aldehyde dehydrogenase family protein [Treponema sp.]